MDVIRKIQNVICDINDKPRIPVVIINCGEVDDPRAYLRKDPFKKSDIEAKNL